MKISGPFCLALTMGLSVALIAATLTVFVPAILVATPAMSSPVDLLVDLLESLGRILTLLLVLAILIEATRIAEIIHLAMQRGLLRGAGLLFLLELLRELLTRSP